DVRDNATLLRNQLDLPPRLVGVGHRLHFAGIVDREATSPLGNGQRVRSHRLDVANLAGNANRFANVDESLRQGSWNEVATGRPGAFVASVSDFNATASAVNLGGLVLAVALACDNRTEPHATVVGGLFVLERLELRHAVVDARLIVPIGG